MSEYERDFKGVFIPKAVWLDARLSALDKIILTEIDSLDSSDRGCFASNKHIAEFCQCSETKVSTAISKLVKLGYLRVQSFDGRRRILKSCLSNSESLHCKKSEAESQNTQYSNYKEFNYKEIDNRERDKEALTSYEIIVALYNEACPSLTPVEIITEARKNAARNLRVVFGMERIKRGFEMAEASTFLKGKNTRGWCASFDWLCDPGNMAKVLEGNFADRKCYVRGVEQLQQSSYDTDEFFLANCRHSLGDDFDPSILK